MFLLVVDRDNDIGRRQVLNRLEEDSRANLEVDRTLLAENAWQEIEVWALAGQVLPKNWSWNVVRAETHPKEVYFEPFAKERGLHKEPGEGRVTLGREAAQNYTRVRSRCPEDIAYLEQRLREFVDES